VLLTEQSDWLTRHRCGGALNRPAGSLQTPCRVTEFPAPRPGLFFGTRGAKNYKRFFEDLDALCRAGPPVMEEVIRVAGRYELEFLE